MKRCLIWLGVFVTGCGPAPAAKQPEVVPPSVVSETPDAAPAPAIVAAPEVPAQVTEAPSWVFGYHTDQRSETWTLQHADGLALLVVETQAGTTRYIGTAVDDKGTLAVRVSTPNAKMALDCKHEKRAIGAACNDRKAPKIDVLACYHPDFETAMPFGQAPGIEYVVDATCNGYRAMK